MSIDIISPIAGLEASAIQFYKNDSGVDIYVPVGTEVRSVSDGMIVYSEEGHTPWNKPPDTPNSVLILLDPPLNYENGTYYYAWYTHLSALKYNVPDDGGKTVRNVKKGEVIGKTGVGNGQAHLHFGLLVNRKQESEQDWLVPALLAKLLQSVIDDDIEQKIMKLFYHDGKCNLIIGGEKREITSIEMNLKYIA